MKKIFLIFCAASNLISCPHLDIKLIKADSLTKNLNLALIDSMINVIDKDKADIKIMKKVFEYIIDIVAADKDYYGLYCFRNKLEKIRNNDNNPEIASLQLKIDMKIQELHSKSGLEIL